MQTNRFAFFGVGNRVFGRFLRQRPGRRSRRRRARRRGLEQMSAVLGQVRRFVSGLLVVADATVLIIFLVLLVLDPRPGRGRKALLLRRLDDARVADRVHLQQRVARGAEQLRNSDYFMLQGRFGDLKS